MRTTWPALSISAARSACSVAAEVEDLALLPVAGLLEAGCDKGGIVRAVIMQLQNVSRVFLYLFELEGKEQGPGFKVAELENAQRAICQIVVSVSQGAFIGRKAEEM